MDALKVIEGGDVDALMADLGRRARIAAQRVALASAEEKNAALRAMAICIRAHERAILAANAEDLADARDKGQSGAFIDRLVLNPSASKPLPRPSRALPSCPIRSAACSPGSSGRTA